MTDFKVHFEIKETGDKLTQVVASIGPREAEREIRKLYSQYSVVILKVKVDKT